MVTNTKTFLSADNVTVQDSLRYSTQTNFELPVNGLFRHKIDNVEIIVSPISARWLCTTRPMKKKLFFAKEYIFYL